MAVLVTTEALPPPLTAVLAEPEPMTAAATTVPATARAQPTEYFGTIKTYSEAKRFGFVTTAAGADVFVRLSQMCFDRDLRCAGTAVLFQIETNFKGKAEAKNVRPAAAASAIDIAAAAAATAA